MMSTENLDFLVAEIQREFRRAADFSAWLQSGVRSIVFDRTDPAEAFSPGVYIIGGDALNWKEDLRAIHDALPQRSQLFLRTALRDAIDLVPPHPEANDPGLDGGRTWEHLVLNYLDLARIWRCGEILSTLDGLIRTKYPKSTAVYSAAVYTWRILAVYDSHTNWREIFLPHGDLNKEPRFRSIFSVPIVLGMCAAQPRRTSEFLQWGPFQEHIAQLTQDLSPDSVAQLNQLVQAYDDLRHNLPAPARDSRFDKVAIMKQQLSGIKGNLAEGVHKAYSVARQQDRPLPSTGIAVQVAGKTLH